MNTILPINSSVTAEGFTSLSAVSLSNTYTRIEIAAACITYGFGFLGNIFSFVVFYSQDEFRRVSTGLLFLLITMFNTVHLWTLTTEFLDIFSIAMYTHVFVQCRLNYFVQNVSRAMSTYLAVTITIDRWIRLKSVIYSRRVCTSRNVMKLTLVYLVVFSVLCSFWFCPLNTYIPGTRLCYTGRWNVYTTFVSHVFFPLRFFLVCVVPISIMILANYRLLSHLQQSRRRIQPRLVMNANGRQGDDRIVLRRMTSFDRMILYMMLVNVTTFVLTQIPFHTYTLVRTYHRALTASTHLLVRAALLIWSSIYFGVAFYLYCTAAPLFRRKFADIVKSAVVDVGKRFFCH